MINFFAPLPSLTRREFLQMHRLQLSLPWGLSCPKLISSDTQHGYNGRTLNLEINVYLRLSGLVLKFTKSFGFISTSATWACWGVFSLVSYQTLCVIFTQMLTCFYQMSVHHAAQSAQLWRSAMEGKLLIANPNCTTAIAAMALWPSAAQCDDNPKGVIVCRRKRRFLSHQFPTKSSVGHGFLAFSTCLSSRKVASNSWVYVTCFLLSRHVANVALHHVFWHVQGFKITTYCSCITWIPWSDSNGYFGLSLSTCSSPQHTNWWCGTASFSVSPHPGCRCAHVAATFHETKKTDLTDLGIFISSTFLLSQQNSYEHRMSDSQISAQRTLARKL